MKINWTWAIFGFAFGTAINPGLGILFAWFYGVILFPPNDKD